MIEILHQVKKIRAGLAKLEALIYAHRERHQLNGGDPLELDASQIISGTFDVARIPDLDASKIVSGVFDVARIPDLDASKITSGVFDVARIPDLDASKIVSGVFDIARIPDIPRSKVPDFWDVPFWDNIPDKPSTFPPSAHASTHLAGGSDDLESHLRLAKLYERSHNSLTNVTAFQHHGHWAHYGKIPTTAPTGAKERVYVDSYSIYVHDGTSWVRRATRHWNYIVGKPSTYPPSAHTHPRSDITDFWNSPFWDNIPDKPSTFPPSTHTHPRSDITDFWNSPFWDNIPDKPSTFPPSAHASSHLSGGADAITGWISPSHIGPRSDTQADVIFRTLDISGSFKVPHRFRPSHDNWGYLGDDSYRWNRGYIYSLWWTYGYARGNLYTLFPYDENTHYHVRPFSDGYSYIGDSEHRFNLVRAITITQGDLGFEEMRCMVCGKPFKENDSIVLKVRKVDKDNRQILTVPVHAECNPHEISEEMKEYHEREVLAPRKNPQDELRYKMLNPEVKFEIVWEQPINEELMYIQANFEDGVSICPIVRIDATEEEVINIIKEQYLREKHKLIQEKIDREKGKQKLKKLGKTWKGKKFTITLETKSYKKLQ